MFDLRSYLYTKSVSMMMMFVYVDLPMKSVSLFYLI